MSDDQSVPRSASSGSGAAGQYLGYSLQLNRVLTHLVEGDLDATVILESVGDVVRETGHGTLVEEDKSSTSKSNPISDRAVPLWKTLRNWMDLLESGVVSGQLEFHLRVAQPFDGSLVTRMGNAASDAEASAVVEELEAAFQESPSSESLRPFVEAVLHPDRRGLLRTLIRGFRFSVGTGTSDEELLNLLRRTVVPEEHLGDVLSHLLGWLKRETDGLIEIGRPAVVTVADFRTEHRAIVRKLDRQSVLRSYALGPTDEDVGVEVRGGRRFLRQLELVDEPEDSKLAAVRSYLKSRTNQIHWARLGLIHSSDLDELQDDLTSVWRNKRGLVDLRDSGRAPQERGRILLYECLGHHCRVQGMETPSDFTAGAFHALADEPVIGWHPEYEELLAAEERG